MEDDASNLGVKHAVVNIALNHVASGSGIEYQYQGKTYYMNTGYIHELDRQIKELHNRGMVLTAVIVLQWNYQQQDLILLEHVVMDIIFMDGIRRRQQEAASGSNLLFLGKSICGTGYGRGKLDLW